MLSLSAFCIRTSDLAERSKKKKITHGQIPPGYTSEKAQEHKVDTQQLNAHKMSPELPVSDVSMQKFSRYEAFDQITPLG